MTPPHTPQPNRLLDSVATDESTSTQIFGVMYITLIGLIDSMVPTSRPWAILGKLLSYIVKLAPILWWALPSGPTGRPPASSQEPPSGWIPDNNPTLCIRRQDKDQSSHRLSVVIHMCAVLKMRVDLASNKDNMLKSENVWLAGNAAWLVGNKGLPEADVAST
ncbi:hypothetical protein DSO57_1036736 [Entomophthora muscae]|uniref:Uncharacterized protein n=1 Tax=Entomophthora muscae TaxID=34485 RepID=A0ACC2T9Z8_9FUNG|nr:hypothetical protein DSO57_1036736 [Entomophthora muscae]